MKPHENEPRGSRLPLPPDHWWRTRVLVAMEAWAKDRRLRRPGWRALAAAVAKQPDVDLPDTPSALEIAVSRCVKGENVTWEMAIPISRVLGLPPPATISTSEEHAGALDDAEIMLLVQQVRKLGLKVQVDRDQGPVVQRANEHSGRERRRRG
jgi:hypothetical protein